MASTKITQLAALIEENTAKVNDYLQDKGLPSPSFDEDGPVDFGIESEDIRNARVTALESSLELHDLLLGPAPSRGMDPSACLVAPVRKSDFLADEVE